MTAFHQRADGTTAPASLCDEIDNRRGQDAALVEAWATWLRGMRWSYFATGTWTRPVTADTALAVVRRWLAPLDGAYAAVGVQRGPVAQKYHVHLLVGGVKRTDLTETLLRGSWVTGGHMRIEGYHPRLGGVEYLVQQADEIELVGEPKPYRP